MANTSAILEATRGARALFYLVLPSEERYEHLSEVPNYVNMVWVWLSQVNLYQLLSC